MRIAPTIPISDLRLTRLLLWAGLWLAWLARMLVGADITVRAAIAHHARRRARAIASVIILRVVKQPRVLHRPNRPWPMRGRGGWRRAVIGSQLRRALRARDLGACIAKLCAAVRDADVLIARLARRLRRGLSRRRPILASRGPAATVCDAHPVRIACADTS